MLVEWPQRVRVPKGDSVSKLIGCGGFQGFTF